MSNELGGCDLVTDEFRGDSAISHYQNPVTHTENFR